VVSVPKLCGLSALPENVVKPIFKPNFHTSVLQSSFWLAEAPRWGLLVSVVAFTCAFIKPAFLTQKRHGEAAYFVVMGPEFSYLYSDLRTT
jgi:hypothetical protein